MPVVRHWHNDMIISANVFGDPDTGPYLPFLHALLGAAAAPGAAPRRT